MALLRGSENRGKYAQPDHYGRRMHTLFVTDLYTLHPQQLS